MHLNCQSISSDEKQLSLIDLINKNKPTFISLNETFLKPNSPLCFNNFTICRSDRPNKRGGGVAICANSAFDYTDINLAHLNTQGTAVGVLSTFNKTEKLAILSIYCSPSQQINEDLFRFIDQSFQQYINLGDLNAKSRIWHCSESNKRGRCLEILINELQMHIINSKTPTYNRSKSVIDLCLVSKSLISKTNGFKVLPNVISDHQPVKFALKHLKIKEKPIKLKSINWQNFKKELESDPDEIKDFKTRPEIDKEASDITDLINKAI